jgi:hypothetical protein
MLNPTTTARWRWSGAIAPALLTLLGACSNGSDHDTPVAPASPAAISEVPSSALVSARAYSEFARSLIKSESADGLKLSTGAAPTSDSEEPIPVI